MVGSRQLVRHLEHEAHVAVFLASRDRCELASLILSKYPMHSQSIQAQHAAVPHVWEGQHKNKAWHSREFENNRAQTFRGKNRVRNVHTQLEVMRYTFAEKQQKSSRHYNRQS